MRAEGSVYKVTFINQLEITSFKAAKLITNGLVLEAKENKLIKQHLRNAQIVSSPDLPYHSKRKLRQSNGITFGEYRSYNGD